MAGELGGTTLSGFYVPPYPPGEEQFLRDLCATGPASFDKVLEAVMAAQGASSPLRSRAASRPPRLSAPSCCGAADFQEPEAPLEYNSNAVLRNDMVKHTRKVLGPQQQFRKPLTTSQEVGWELGNRVPGDTSLQEVGKHPFHLRTSATTQFQDAQEKHTWGRSIGGEFSQYASRKLLEFGGFGIGI